MSDNEFSDGPIDDGVDADEGYRPTDSKKKKVKTIFKEYSVLTTMHGINHLGESDDARVAAFWIATLLLCLVLFILLFYYTMARFLRFEYSVDISMQTDESAFPAVTFCSLSPYTLTGMQQDPDLSAMLSAYNYALNATVGLIESWNVDQVVRSV